MNALRWPFRRRRPEPSGSLRLGQPSPDPSDYCVWTVSESRHPEAFEALWSSADDDEVRVGVLRRWARLVPVRDPRFGVAEVVVELDGRPACYLRPPHIAQVAARLDDAGAAAAEVPALIERSPAGATVRLLL